MRILFPLSNIKHSAVCIALAVACSANAHSDFVTSDNNMNLVSEVIAAKTRLIVHLKQTNASTNNLLTVNDESGTLKSISVLRKLPSINAVVVEASKTEWDLLSRQNDVLLVEKDPVRFLQGQLTPYGIFQVSGESIPDSLVSNTPICVIDSGVDINHEDLSNNTNTSGEVVNRLSQVIDLGDWSTDVYGHGTHVTGIISAVDNSFGIKGVISSGLANIHHVKIIHNPNYWQMWGSDLVDAIGACRQAGTKVVNMSIGGGDASVAEESAMQAAYDSGMLLVASAGSRGSSSFIYPASYDSVIAVGAVDRFSEPWPFTQINSQIELVAAGLQVRSTLPNNKYRDWDGTSMSAPHVSGAAAIIWSHFPQCSAQRIRETLTQTAIDLGQEGRDSTFGYGLPQINAAITYLQTNGCTEPAQPILTFHDSLNTFDSQNEINIYEDFENFLADLTPTMSVIKKGINYEYVTHRPEDNGFVVMPSGSKERWQTELDMTSRTLTGNGEDDFIIYPPVDTFGIGFDTFISRFGPIFIEVETVSGYKETYTHSHEISKLGFVGVTSIEAIKSIYFNAQTNKSINTGIDDLRLITNY